MDANSNATVTIAHPSELIPYDDVVEVLSDGKWLDYGTVRDDERMYAFLLCRDQPEKYRLRRSVCGDVQYPKCIQVEA
ncbi:MAG TPA: hypothetical protein V6C65_24620 [Allocoleopsis sp.]